MSRIVLNMGTPRVMATYTWTCVISQLSDIPFSLLSPQKMNTIVGRLSSDMYGKWTPLADEEEVVGRNKGQAVTYVVQSSWTNGSSPFSIRHRFVASNTPGNPSNNHPHFFKKPSDISHPVMSQGGDHAIMPRRSISSSGKPSYSPPMQSAHNTSSSKVPVARIRRSRPSGHGNRSIQSPCGTVC